MYFKTTENIASLGPCLFIFYINYIFDKINEVKIMMFADDCVLYNRDQDGMKSAVRQKLWSLSHNKDVLSTYMLF